MIDRVLISRERIAGRTAELGAALTTDLRAAGADAEGQRVVMIPVLTGAMLFVADLVRHVPLKMAIRPLTVSSYPGSATSSQGAHIRGELPTDLAGAHVVLVDDILDSGRTLGLLSRVMQAQNPVSLRLAVLLDKQKPGGRDEDVKVDYAGFQIEDAFVVGYGLDYDGYYRNLPDICILKV